MALTVVRLRRWFALAGILACLIVVGVYFHARHSVQNALKQVPEKLNIQIQQSANSFTVSKSEQGRTLFKLQAGKAVQFKQGGRANLQDVMITIYGRDSARFDQIYGKNFEYDQQTGDVTSTGEVSIDLQSNPQGVSAPDQATPKELKNPVHLKTTGLVFNQKTGDAWTPSLVEFYVPQMDGSAVGAKYDAKQNLLTLQSHVKMTVSSATPLTVLAEHAVLGRDPREVVLQRPKLESRQENGWADEATLYLRDDNTLDHAIATGNVGIKTTASSSATEVTSQKLEVAVRPRNQIQGAIFSGDVHLKTEGPQPSEGTAGRAVLTFANRNMLSKIHAEEQVKLLQHQGSAASPTQDVEVTAPMMDIRLADGNRLTDAETFGPPQIRMFPPEGKPGETTVVTADKFTAKFDSAGQISLVHGEAHTRVVSSGPSKNNVAQPQRISTSDRIDAYFRTGTGIETLVQDGHFAYQAGSQQAFANAARYTPADQILALNGSPRFIDSGTETIANAMRLNRATGEAFASGDVKTTYNDLKPQPDGGMLASSNPIHVTAESMTAHNNPGSATYKGNARLWQDANLVEAPTIQFQKDERMVMANSDSQRKVSTALTSIDKNATATPIHVTSDHLTYYDSERKAHYEGSVVAQSPDMTVTCNQMDVFFASVKQSAETQAVVEGRASSAVQDRSVVDRSVAPQITAAKLDKIIANGVVIVTQPNRRATGDKLIYTSADDKFVMTGGPPSIFDAEHGKITGVSLTLYRTDDRVVVEGNGSSPAVTETRVVR